MKKMILSIMVAVVVLAAGSQMLAPKSLDAMNSPMVQTFYPNEPGG